MKKVILLQILLVVLCIMSFSQSMDVFSFEILPNDQTARVTDPVLDLNGEKCALIKVVTTERGFAWEGGMLGIARVEDKTGEIWLYVPRGAKKLTIKHDEYGVLRNYIYPTSIREATVYELILGIDAENSGKPAKSEWIVINTKPDGADVYIDDEYAGVTPFQQEMWEGKHTYRIEKNFYKNQAGTFLIVPSKGKTILDLDLEANFGQLSINTAPVSGASVIIDGQNTNMVTPYKIDQILNGSHMLELRKEWYKPKKLRFDIFSDSLTALNVPLEPNFGIISIECPENTDVYEYGKIIARGPQNVMLNPGVHTIEAKLFRHEDITRKIEIFVGDTAHLRLNFKPQTGILAIQTVPFNATVFVDGEKAGTSPVTINDILVGPHKVKISKEGYADLHLDVNIKADQRIDLKETLQQTKMIQITSDPVNASVYINGTFAGNTPIKQPFNINNEYTVEIKEENYSDESRVISDINTVGEEISFTLTKKVLPLKVYITSDPSGADFYLYNNKMGTTPLTLDISKGRYTVKVKKAGYKTLDESFTVDEFTKNKAFKLQEQTGGFVGTFHNTKGWYWGLGYQQTVFDRLQDWSYKFGMNTKLKYTVSPVSFEIMPFLSYYTFDPEDFFAIDLTETDELWHYGTEFSMIAYPLPFVKQFMPYLGLGFDASNLASTNDLFDSNISTSSGIFKIGIDMYLGKNILQAEYKRSGFESLGDRTREYYSNAQFSISLIFGLK